MHITLNTPAGTALKVRREQKGLFLGSYEGTRLMLMWDRTRAGWMWEIGSDWASTAPIADKALAIADMQAGFELAFGGSIECPECGNDDDACTCEEQVMNERYAATNAVEALAEAVGLGLIPVQPPTLTVVR